MTVTTTPALDLAGALYALAEHLVEHPDLPSVDIDSRTAGLAGISLQISTYPHHGEPEDAAAALQWAKSFDDPKIGLKKTTLAIHVEAMLDGRAVRVWTCDYGDLKRWHNRPEQTRITLEQLAAYVAAGTVEHADEHVAATS